LHAAIKTLVKSNFFQIVQPNFFANVEQKLIFQQKMWVAGWLKALSIYYQKEDRIHLLYLTNSHKKILSFLS
jgi:hypothetical protein